MNSKKSKKEKAKADKPTSNDLKNSEIVTNISENSKKKKKKADNNNVENIGNAKPGKKRKNKKVPEENTSGIVAKKSKKNKLNTSQHDNVSTNGLSFNGEEQYIKKELSDEDDSEILDIKVNIKENNAEMKKEEVMWSNEDLMQLVANMEQLIPDNDLMAFTTRTEKLEWEKVIFKNYTVEECKKTWNLLSKKIRKFRLLHEVLEDARQLIVNPPSQKNKKKAHPDMPKRPLSSYLLFYLSKKDKVIAENPGIELTEISKKIGKIYKDLPPVKKAVYEKMAAKAKEEYEEKMKEFYENHPEFKVVKAPKVPVQKPVKERVPKKPATPFNFYFQSELAKENIPDSEKQQFKEECRSRWKQMSDKKKLTWITWAEEQSALYENDLENYKANHPGYVVNHATKLVLTKEEQSVKERVAGKPIKPPNSAYALFSKNILHTAEIKDIPNKERWNYVAAQWKTCSEEEKKHYKDLQANLMDQYKVDFAQYLETLPEDKRNLEIQVNTPKKRKSDEHQSKTTKKRRKSVEKPSSAKPESKPTKFQEPEQPPRSPFKYFAMVYTGKESAAQAWRKLSASEKKKYEEESIKKKREYIVAFEKFLKSLTKEELAAFSNSRNKVKQQSAAESDDEEDEDEEEEGDEQDDESENGDSSGSNSESSDDDADF